MPANAIRRSDDNITEKYERFADKLSKIKEQSDTPKFYEYGKSVVYQEKDKNCLPTFTTNYINLSDLNGKVSSDSMAKVAQTNSDFIGEQESRFNAENDREARAKRRRIIAQLEEEYDPTYDDDYVGEFDEEVEEPTGCPRCGEEYNIEITSPKESLINKYKCNNCGDEWKDNIDLNMIDEKARDEFPLPYGEESPVNIKEILSSIETMLPNITAKVNKPMNKMAGNIVSGLINSLNIEKSNKQWLNAQIENGILNSEVFMRNVKASLQTGGVQ